MFFKNKQTAERQKTQGNIRALARYFQREKKRVTGYQKLRFFLTSILKANS